MLRIYFHRKYSGFIAAVSAVVATAGGIALARAGSTVPPVVQVAGWFIILAMLWGIIVGVRQLLRPPLMYSADRRGVTIYYDADRIRFTGNGVFLPWRSVTGMTIEKRTAVGATHNRAYTWVIACTLEGSAPFPVQKYSVAYSARDGERVVCLDAFTGTLSGQAMLDRLHSLWQAAPRGTERPL